MAKIIDLSNDTVIKSLYEVDEHQWLLDQVALLESGKMNELDREHLIEYLTEMSISERRELESRFIVLLEHMLKFMMQPEKASKSWARTIREQQRKLNSLLTLAPSLKRYVPGIYIAAYPHAVIDAADETSIDRNKFPAVCPWSVEQALAYEPPTVP